MSNARKFRSVTLGLAAVVVTLAVAWPAMAWECPPGTGTPGYWVNHPEAWPPDCHTGEPGIWIQTRFYPQEEAIGLMNLPVQGDKTLTLFPAYVAAVLNITIDNESCCIIDTILAAGKWLGANGVGSGVSASSAAWKCGEPLYLCLDAYNNGLLCAPSRDSLENGD